MPVIKNLILVIALVALVAGTPPATNVAVPECKPAKSTLQHQCSIRAFPRIRSNYKASIIFEPIRTSSPAGCAYFCSRRAVSKRHNQAEGGDYCSSFEFDPNLQSCQLFNRNVSYILNEVAKMPKKTYIYNDLGCYDCGDQFCDTPQGQPYGAQLLDNGDFENKYALGLWDAAHVGVERQGRNTFVNLSATDNGYYGVSLSQYFNLCPHEYYEISFDYFYLIGSKIPSGDYPQTLTFMNDISTDGWATITSKSSVGNAIRGQARYIFKAGYGTRSESVFSSTFYSYPASPYWSFTIDNAVAVRRPPTFTAVPSSVSPVPNGDFESGQVNPWKLSNLYFLVRGAAKVISPGLSGSDYALQVQLDYVTVPYSLTSGRFETKPKAMYIVSAELARGNKSANHTLKIQVGLAIIGDGAETLHTFPPKITSRNPTKFSWPLWSYGKSAQVALSITLFSETTEQILVDNIRLDEMMEDSKFNQEA